MATARSGHATYYLDVGLVAQNWDGNYSTLNIHIYAVTDSGWSGHASNIGWSSYANSGAFSFNGTRAEIANYNVTVGHDGNGYCNFTIGAHVNSTGTSSFGGPLDWSQSGSLPRIPKAPSAPSALRFTSVTTSSASLAWNPPGDDGGAGLNGYVVQSADNPNFSNVRETVFGGTSGTIGGLTPGPTYYFRVRADGPRGHSGYSGAVSQRLALPAPTLLTFTQSADAALVATWSPPPITDGLTGYRLQVARDIGFTRVAAAIDLGNALTAAANGLPGGRQYFARVAALTSGGANVYSNTLTTMLVLDAGDTDHWERRPDEIPPGLVYFTSTGLRRGTASGSPALLLETLTTGPAAIAGGSHGITRTIRGLTPGRGYRFTAQGVLTDSAALVTTYRLEASDGETGPNVTLNADTLTSLGQIDLVPTGTSVTVRIVATDDISVTEATDVLERTAFTGLRLLELATDYPVRLRETVYQSNLANHLDLACASTGASWYVSPDGMTRFRLPGAALPVSAVFTDEPVANALHYIDVAASHDTRTLTNRLDVTNYGIDDTGDLEENDELVADSADSITAYGVRSSRLEVNLWDLPPYDRSLQARLTAILDTYDTPQLFISSLRWNAAENFAAAAHLDVGQRVLVSFHGVTQDSQITSILHTITPKRWIVSLNLARIGGA